jgi:hypothetical protein
MKHPHPQYADIVASRMRMVEGRRNQYGKATFFLLDTNHLNIIIPL